MTDPVYQTKTHRQDGPCEALILHCSDQRFQKPFNEFLTRGLGLESYGLIAIPGGGHFIPMELFLPAFAKAAFKSLSFMVKRGRPRRLILVGHDDCIFFKEQLQFFTRGTEFNQKQRANLLKARALIAEKYPNVSVEVYFAGADHGGSVQFFAV
jgi:hypothetical protein